MTTLNWQKSSFSEEASSCLYIGTAHGIQLRESDDPDVILTASPARLDALISRIKSGKLDCTVRN